VQGVTELTTPSYEEGRFFHQYQFWDSRAIAIDLRVKSPSPVRTREITPVLRKNTAQLSPSIWACAEDRVKYRVGILIDGYRTNLDDGKLKRGVEFLKHVDGLAFESLPARTVALDLLNNRLRDAHSSWDNFYHEPPVMREILGYCKKSTDIPADIMPSLVKTVISCRVGRGLSYRRGVSPAGKPLYDAFLGMLDDNGVIHALNALFEPEINSKLQNDICQEHLSDLLLVLRRIAISERLQQSLDFLLKDVAKAYRANRINDFRELTRPLIAWHS
jgi:hypothetical protein